MGALSLQLCIRKGWSKGSLVLGICACRQLQFPVLQVGGVSNTMLDVGSHEGLGRPFCFCP